jgi:hypothetical protein
MHSCHKAVLLYVSLRNDVVFRALYALHLINLEHKTETWKKLCYAIGFLLHNYYSF